MEKINELHQQDMTAEETLEFLQKMSKKMKEEREARYPEYERLVKEYNTHIGYNNENL